MVGEKRKMGLHATKYIYIYIYYKDMYIENLGTP